MLPSTQLCPLQPGQPSPGVTLLKRPCALLFGGYGISTVCASATRFRLTLAPGLP